MKAINIDWDASPIVKEILPNEIEIPKEIQEDMDLISDYLSDTTGFCHFGFGCSTEDEAFS